MTLPSTEELQRLLDETPHETWRAEIDEGNEWWNVAPSRFGGSHTLIAEGMSQPVAELMAESRVLAAEVIRLREENERMQERANKHAQETDPTIIHTVEELEALDPDSLVMSRKGYFAYAEDNIRIPAVEVAPGAHVRAAAAHMERNL